MITKYELVGEKNGNGINKKRSRDQEKDAYIGAKIAKKFGDGVVYYGSVVSYNDEDKYWKVKYEDSDSEEFDADELQMYLKFYEEQQKNK